MSVRIRSIIGHTRTIRTAILVCEWLGSHLCNPHSAVHPDALRYEFVDPVPANGQWSATIYVEGDLDRASGEIDLALTSRFVETCRAFVAGAGEIW